jgi:GxxExxY protein
MDIEKEPVFRVDCDEGLIKQTIDSAFTVHNELGPGLLESVYENALLYELKERGILAKQQVPIPVLYKGNDVGIGYRADILVEDVLLLELKTVESFASIHLAQVMTYLRLMNLKRGFLLNFNTVMLKYGIKRISI